MSAEGATQAVTGQKRERSDEVGSVKVPDEMSLPGAAIMRIVKSKLPDGVHFGKDTKAAFGKACSIFILYITTMWPPAPPTRAQLGSFGQPLACSAQPPRPRHLYACRLMICVCATHFQRQRPRQGVEAHDGDRAGRAQRTKGA